MKRLRGSSRKDALADGLRSKPLLSYDRGSSLREKSCLDSSVAQWQSIRLLTGGLLVRVQPEEPLFRSCFARSGTNSGQFGKDIDHRPSCLMRVAVVGSGFSSSPPILV